LPVTAVAATALTGWQPVPLARHSGQVARAAGGPGRGSSDPHHQTPGPAPRLHNLRCPDGMSADFSHRLRVGVMGSAGGELTPEIIGKCRDLGRAVGRRGHIMITGACPGLPHFAAEGASAEGGLLVGVSPAMSLWEHINHYHSPHREYDIIIYTGSGLMGREVAAVRSCDVVIILGGRSGTLGEFAIAFDEGKLIGVLRGTGGIADHVHEIVAMIQKKTGAEVVYEDDPVALLDLCEEKHARRVAAGLLDRPALTDEDME